jgi:GAF domain-containing protein
MGMQGQTAPEPGITERYLLQCVVEVAKAAFKAAASSVFIIDIQTGELVFEAVAGEGEDHLIGTRFQPGTGIAGWVVASGQPIIADDLADSDFSWSAAAETGYVPRTIAAAPLMYEGEVVGVIEVLDRTSDHDQLEALDLIGLLSAQAAGGITLVNQVRQQAREQYAGQQHAGSHADMLSDIAADLRHLDDDGEQILSHLLTLVGSISGRAARNSPSGFSLPPQPGQERQHSVAEERGV